MAKILRSMTVFALLAMIQSLPAWAHNCQNEMTIPTVLDQKLVDSIMPNTVLHFDDGQSFFVRKVLSNEGVNAIFQLDDKRVLRVSRFGPTHTQSYYDGYRPLVERYIPVPRVFGKNPALWIVSEFVDVEFLLEDVLKSDSQISDERFEKLLTDFRNFAFKFAGFNKIADLSTENIAYVRGRGWMLIGWQDGHQIGYTRNPFLAILGGQSSNRIYNRDRLNIFRRASNESIAIARGHDVERYSRIAGP